ncbi:MAG: single-stranded-DNA-specific exonuclease RecJ [Planctomycetota bacterium]
MATACDIHPVIARLLVNRGVDTASGIREFLNPSLASLHDPYLLKGMEAAVQRIRQAIDNSEKIVVYGDFDVDGTVSTTLLMLLFRLLGANADFYIPRRMEEGYGLNVPAIARLRKAGCTLLVTVDNGITAVAEVQSARSLGMDVIITDHHVAGEHLPSARAIVNPKQPGCTYPHQNLAGVGVAFKLVWGIAESYGFARRLGDEFNRFLENALGMVCIATIADVVPVIGENRVFVSYGLQALPRVTNPGIRALIDICNLGGQPLDTSHIGFRLAPRLNAGGRLGHEDLGVRMMLSSGYADALKLAEEMEAENKQRQDIEREITALARQQVLDTIDLQHTTVIVIASEDWHPGVIGIVSSRLSEEFYRPTVTIALRGRTGRGSARSIPNFSIYKALATCEDLFISFGGHDFAAGLEIHRDDIDDLRLRLNAAAGDLLQPTTLHPSLNLDGILGPHDLTPGLVRQIEQLAPHGESNPLPLFATPPVEVAGRPRLVGKSDQHVSFFVREPGRPDDQPVRAIAFHHPAWAAMLSERGGLFRIAYQPRMNRSNRSSFNGQVEMVVKDIHPAAD